jgi:hypothetical protein
MIKKTMTKEEILDIFKLVEDLNKMSASISSFVKNKENSFEDRLEVFVNTPKQFYTMHPWIMHLPEFEEKYGSIDWFDDFYSERHEIVDLTTIVANADEYTTTEEWDDEKFRAFQEAVLNKGIHAFTLDW